MPPGHIRVEATVEHGLGANSSGVAASLQQVTVWAHTGGLLAAFRRTPVLKVSLPYTSIPALGQTEHTRGTSATGELLKRNAGCGLLATVQ